MGRSLPLFPDMALGKEDSHSFGAGTRERERSWGGKRPGAGRPHLPWRRGAPHRSLPEIRGWTPLHVTFSRLPGLGSLWVREIMLFTIRVFQECKEREGFRILAWSVQRNHGHMIVEAESKEALSRAMRGFLARLAKGWNRIWERKGPVFAGRYHVRVVRNAWDGKRLLGYVLKNHAKHEGRFAGTFHPMSSTFWMDVWFEREEWLKERRRCGFEGKAMPIVEPVTEIFREVIRPGVLSVYGIPQGYRRDWLTPYVATG